MGRAVSRARNGEGPSTLVGTITRFYGHFEGDPQNYRAKDEVSGYRETMDCLKRFRASTATNSAFTAAELNAIDAEVLHLIDAVTTEARAAPMPGSEELTTDVYIAY